MSLWENMTVKCQMMDKVTEPDGAGGISNHWQEGAVFDAAIVKDESIQAEIAQKSGVTSVYTITCRKNVSLRFPDVFKRLKDGKIFRVTSDTTDSSAPAQSRIQFVQCKAEEWYLT